MRQMPGQDLTGFHKVLFHPWNEGMPKHTFTVCTVSTTKREEGRERKRQGETERKTEKGGAPTSTNYKGFNLMPKGSLADYKLLILVTRQDYSLVTVSAYLVNWTKIRRFGRTYVLFRDHLDLKT
eukprot:13976317-Heterocapsa_arctica.AAC.1